jgi:hypothetical protein
MMAGDEFEGDEAEAGAEGAAGVEEQLGSDEVTSEESDALKGLTSYRSGGEMRGITSRLLRR